jgi:YD repeat-containing protein
VTTPTTGAAPSTATQPREHNAQNQLAGIDDGTTQTNLAHDANGNLTTDQTGNTLIYDPWNRLVEVKDGLTTLQRYECDALKRRIEENAHAATPTVL